VTADESISFLMTAIAKYFASFHKQFALRRQISDDRV
jgi:hypothetical protein